MPTDRRNQEENDRHEVGDKAAASLRGENTKWTGKQTVTSRAKAAEKLGGKGGKK